MSLENIFTMIKADRYTEDGCEQLNKARKEIEDARRFYKPGEISQTTGLMKTEHGWVEPKKAQKAAGTKQSETSSGKWQKNKDYLGRERISMKTPQGGKVSIYESDNPKQKNARFRVDTGSHYNEFNTMEEAKAFAEKQYGAGSKPEAEPQPTLRENASKYVFSDVDRMSDEDKVFRALVSELDESFGDRDGNPDNVEEWAESWAENAETEGGIGFMKSHGSDKPDAVVSGKKVLEIIEKNPKRWNRIIKNAKQFYSGNGHSGDFESEEYYPEQPKADMSKEIAENRETAQYYRRKAGSFNEGDPSRETYTKKAEEYEKKADELEKGTKSASSHPMVGQKFNPAQDESEMKWADGKSHTTYTAKDGTGNDKEGTRRALVVREDENGNGVYGVINYDKITGKINYMKEYSDEGEANREYDALLAKSKSSLNDAAPRVLTGDCRIRIRK